MRHLVQQDLRAHGAAGVGGGAAVEHAVGPCDAAPVLHRAAHVRHEHLVVALLGERLAELLTEKREPAVGEVEQLLGVALEVRAQRLPAEQAEVVAASRGPDLVERPGVDDGDVRRQPRGVSERPASAAVAEVLDQVRRGVARDRPGFMGVDDEPVRCLEVRLVETGEREACPVGLEGGPDVDELVERVDRFQDRGAGTGVGLGVGDHQDVVGPEIGQRDAPPLGGTGVERLAVESHRRNAADAVDERARAGLPAAERDCRRGSPQPALEEAAQVDVHVVPLDVDERRALGGFVPSEARDVGHGATVPVTFSTAGRPIRYRIDGQCP